MLRLWEQSRPEGDPSHVHPRKQGNALLARSMRKALVPFSGNGHLSEVLVHDCPQHGAQPGETRVQGCDLIGFMESCCDSSHTGASFQRKSLKYPVSVLWWMDTGCWGMTGWSDKRSEFLWPPPSVRAMEMLGVLPWDRWWARKSLWVVDWPVYGNMVAICCKCSNQEEVVDKADDAAFWQLQEASDLQPWFSWRPWATAILAGGTRQPSMSNPGRFCGVLITTSWHKWWVGDGRCSAGPDSYKQGRTGWGCKGWDQP